jgi:hypothetical protein
LHQAVFETVAARNDHRRGWTSTIERFAEYLAAQSAFSSSPRSQGRG